jgi:hypothetical protein
MLDVEASIMPKTFAWRRRDGKTVEGDLDAVMAAGSREIEQGEGPFRVVRGDWYSHPDLTRTRALRVFRTVLTENLEIGEFVHVNRGAGAQVFRCKRVAPPAEYRNPLRDCVNLQPRRQDMGVDYAVSKDSPIYAIGPGKITDYRKTSGWPRHKLGDGLGSYIAYRFTDGPAKDKYVYLAENITLASDLKVGSKVNTKTVIAKLHPQIANCEMGWADADSNGHLALAFGEYQEGQRTRAGDNFSKFMVALGAPAGFASGRPISGTLPANWPKGWDTLV